MKSEKRGLKMNRHLFKNLMIFFSTFYIPMAVMLPEFCFLLFKGKTLIRDVLKDTQAVWHMANTTRRLFATTDTQPIACGRPVDSAAPKVKIKLLTNESLGEKWV